MVARRARAIEILNSRTFLSLDEVARHRANQHLRPRVRYFPFHIEQRIRNIKQGIVSGFTSWLCFRHYLDGQSSQGQHNIGHGGWYFIKVYFGQGF
jgi:hypothetical protein